MASDIICALMDKCLANDADEEVRYSIQDLELLIERHTQNRYGQQQYQQLFYHDGLYQIRLEKQDADTIVYFLFYLLFNYQDRAGDTSQAIKKCYNYNILPGCYVGIKYYYLIDDWTTVNLMDAILNHRDTEGDLQTEYIELFKIIKEEGLPYAKEYITRRWFADGEKT